LSGPDFFVLGYLSESSTNLDVSCGKPIMEYNLLNREVVSVSQRHACQQHVIGLRLKEPGSAGFEKGFEERERFIAVLRREIELQDGKSRVKSALWAIPAAPYSTLSNSGSG
jgi:hypothetical protein